MGNFIGESPIWFQPLGFNKFEQMEPFLLVLVVSRVMELMYHWIDFIYCSNKKEKNANILYTSKVSTVGIVCHVLYTNNKTHPLIISPPPIVTIRGNPHAQTVRFHGIPGADKVAVPSLYFTIPHLRTPPKKHNQLH